MDRDCFWLSEAQFARLAPHLPTDTRGKPRVDDRRVISGIVHVLKTGGVWTAIFHALASADGPPAQVLIDSSAVKAHRCASGGKGGSSRRPSAARAAAGPRRSML